MTDAGVVVAGVAIFTATVHEFAPAARLPALNAKLVAPATALTVPEVQVVTAFGVGATTNPAPIVVKSSVKAMLLRAGAPLACVNVTVSRETAPA